MISSHEVFPIQNLYSFLIYSIRATDPAPFILLDFVTLIIFAEKRKLYLFVTASRSAHSAFYPLGDFFRNKSAGSEAEHLPLSSSDKNVRSYISIPPYI
jgi:hypothetical protein